MAIRNILSEEDPILHKVCRPVEKFDARLHQLLDDMAETLHQANGVGLAAPQVGILRQVFIVLDENERLLEFVNPKMLEQTGSQVTNEGCLSVPGYYAYTDRPQKVKLQAQDRKGRTFEVTASGQTAKALCHEYDHLQGVLFRQHVVREMEEDEE